STRIDRDRCLRYTPSRIARRSALVGRTFRPHRNGRPPCYEGSKRSMIRKYLTFTIALMLAGMPAGSMLAASTLRPPVSKQVPSVQSAPVSGTFGVWTVHMTEVDYNNTTGNFNTPNHVTMTRNGGD